MGCRPLRTNTCTHPSLWCYAGDSTAKKGGVPLGQRLNLSEIVTERVLAPDDDISPLAKHINDTGLQVPLLVTPNNHLVDGLRRLEAVRSLGQSTIEVNAVSLYPHACAWIKRTREHGVEALPLTPYRIWEIYKALQPLASITRSYVQSGRRKGQSPKFSVGGRPMLADALGLTSDSPLQAITQVFRAAEEDPTERGDRAREAAARLVQGKTTIYMAAEATRAHPRVYGGLQTPTAQRKALQNMGMTMDGLGYAMEQFGPLSKALQGQETEDWLTSLRKFRRKLARFIHQLEEETNES
jgi:hypothetical protein